MNDAVTAFYVTLCWTLATFVTIGIVIFTRRRALPPLRQREPIAVIIGCIACVMFLIMEGVSHVVTNYSCMAQVLHAFLPILISSLVYSWRSLNLAFAYAITAHHNTEIRHANHIHHLTLHSAPGSARSTIASSTATGAIGNAMAAVAAVTAAPPATVAAVAPAPSPLPPPSAGTGSGHGSGHGVHTNGNGTLTPRRHLMMAASSAYPQSHHHSGAAAGGHHHHYTPPQCWVRYRAWRQSWQLVCVLGFAAVVFCSLVGVFISQYSDIRHGPLFCTEAALFHKLLPAMMVFFFSLFALVAVSLRKVDDDTWGIRSELRITGIIFIVFLIPTSFSSFYFKLDYERDTFPFVFFFGVLWAAFSSLYSLFWPLARSIEIGARHKQKLRQAQHRAWAGAGAGAGGGGGGGGQVNGGSRVSASAQHDNDTKITLQQLLSTDAGINSFRRYLTTEFSVESLAFYTAVNRFIHFAMGDRTADEVAAQAVALYHKFIVPNAPFQVNLSSQLVHAIRAELAMHLPNDARRTRSSLIQTAAAAASSAFTGHHGHGHSGGHGGHQPSSILVHVASPGQGYGVNGNGNGVGTIAHHSSVPPSPVPRSIVPVPPISTSAPLVTAIALPTAPVVRLPPIRANIFADALHEVMTMLQNDVLPRYIKSELYQEYRRSLQLQ